MALIRRSLILLSALACVCVNLHAQQDEKAPIPDDLPTPQVNNETRFALAVTNETSIASGERVPLPQVSNIALLQSSFSYKRGQRWRFSTSLTGESDSSPEASSRLQVREAYVGLSTGDFDWTLGKRILKWGTGYAFTPTGVLDPPRIPTDPIDHLSLNQGRELGSLRFRLKAERCAFRLRLPTETRRGAGVIAL